MSDWSDDPLDEAVSRTAGDGYVLDAASRGARWYWRVRRLVFTVSRGFTADVIAFGNAETREDAMDAADLAYARAVGGGA